MVKCIALVLYRRHHVCLKIYLELVVATYYVLTWRWTCTGNASASGSLRVRHCHTTSSSLRLSLRLSATYESSGGLLVLVVGWYYSECTGMHAVTLRLPVALHAVTLPVPQWHWHWHTQLRLGVRRVEGPAGAYSSSSRMIDLLRLLPTTTTSTTTR
jgi:hypothetical protein